MSKLDTDKLSSIKAMLRKQAFVPTAMLGQDPTGGAPSGGAPGMSPGAPPTPGGMPQDPSMSGGDPTSATGGAGGGMDPNMPGGGPGGALPGMPNASGGKNAGKINDLTFLASEIGEVKGRMNLMIELMQGQMNLNGGGQAGN